MITRFECPEQSEALAMLAEERVGFEDEARIFPICDATGEEDKPKAIRLRKGGLFDLAVKDYQLSSKQGILGDQIGLTASQVGG